MSFIRLLVCVTGVYSMFLLWAIAQERLSVPFQHIDASTSHKFKFPLFMGTCQSFLSALSAFTYILIRAPRSQPLLQTLGLIHKEPARPTTNGQPSKPSTRHSPIPLLTSYLSTSLLITTAAPFGFAALSHISYPAMVLAKSCKLVPVMLMNVLVYRRKFKPYKYLVVSMVTVGITIFMGMGNDSKGAQAKHASKAGAEGGGGQKPLLGMSYLLLNLLLDGLVNSTQDEIFTRHLVSGQQMMFFINIFCTLLTLTLTLLPLPYIPVLHPSHTSGSEFFEAIQWIQDHPGVKWPLVQFAMTGALGQLFIFETLQHFGSLTLVTITLTRKLFTMLLSVIIYNHTLTPGQWAGAAVVFAGISVEAGVKRKEIHAKKVIQEKEKPKIKGL
ncbi:UAA transporter [Crepidotus variabilis]|uniref:UDP-galactose transporter homolog 1 n=1 Tax=Crepidotus variabilis TaxID=179855 RepID=A0A9P6JV16_9AGAR|nr:UAA transporter [Crepidotus variabilis]